MSRPARTVQYGGSNHRIANKPHTGKGPRVHLHPKHPALTEARTLFPTTVVDPRESPRLLVSGMNQRKIGKRVTKGRWKGFPLYTLTLEERATCPSSCGEWSTCYGSNMPFSRRHKAGLALEAILINEVIDLARKHPDGYAVRLHILGDFYSPAYVDLWGSLLAEVPQLHVFGFTANPVDSQIGELIMFMNAAHPDRCRIRFSGVDSLVIDSLADSRHVVCPVQTDKTDCCGSCGLCWTMDRPVEFIRH